MQTVQALVPSFFTTLRDEVYPEFVLLAGSCRPQISWSRFRNLPDLHPFRVCFLRWAIRFHSEKDSWILEGAFNCLSRWHQVPELLASLDIRGFQQVIAESGFVPVPFEFSEAGWDPLCISFAGWRSAVMEQIEAALNAYEAKTRKLASARGLIKTVNHYTKAHLEWLALFQYGNHSLEQIRARYKVTDTTVVSKGIHTAAALAGVVVRRTRKLKT